MKKLLSLLLVSCLLSLPLAARAEDFSGTASDLGSTSSKPPVASDAEVAMIYWLLAGQSPNYDAMARASDEYKKAGDFERGQVLAAQVANLRNIHDNINFTHPTVVRMLVHISPYSEKNKGFVITDFEDQTYFKYSFAGENYAIVPRGLMDHQFLGPVEDATVIHKILAARPGYNSVFHLMVYLKPDYADKPDTLTEVDGLRYHILTGQVAHVSLYDVNDSQQLWGDNSDEFNKAQQEQLMNLKQ